MARTNSGVGGVLFGFRGAKNFYLLQRSPDGHWDLMHHDGTYFPRDEQQVFPSAGSSATITVLPEASGTTLKFDGRTVTVTNTTGHVGLWVDQGRQRFTVKAEPK